VAVLADGRKSGSHSIEYFDPLADPLPAHVQHQLKAIADKIDPTIMMKLKVNHVKHQFDNTDTCGYHAMNFVIDRIQRGKTFPEASGFKDRVENKAGHYEAEIEKLKKVPPFSYITEPKNTEQSGSGGDMPVDTPKPIGRQIMERFIRIKKKLLENRK